MSAPETRSPAWGRVWLDVVAPRFDEASAHWTRGRAAVGAGAPTEFTIEPGRVTGVVAAGRAEHRAQIGVAVLADAEWAALLDHVADQAQLTAAVLTGELPLELAGSDIGLVPARVDVALGCTCRDHVEVCTHTAALVHHVAALLDGDPFALPLLRGRGRHDLVAELHRRRRMPDPPAADEPRGADPGVRAADAYRRVDRPLPPRHRLPARRPMRPAPLVPPPPADSGVRPDDLVELVADGARRALDLLAGTADSALFLDERVDLARRAASHTDADPVLLDHFPALARRAGVDPDELEAAARAYRVGGVAALELDERWVPGAGALEAGQAALGAGARVRANRVTADSVQLRLDRQGRWWRLDADDRLGWVVVDGPAVDPHELVG